MAARQGADFRVEVMFGGDWTPVPGERTSTGRISNETVDSTVKGDYNQYRTLTPCGLRTTEISVSGVLRDDLSRTFFNFLMNRSFDGQIIEARIDDSGDIICDSKYIVASLERSGEFNTAEVYNITLAAADRAAFDDEGLLTEGGLNILTESGATLLIGG